MTPLATAGLPSYVNATPLAAGLADAPVDLRRGPMVELNRGLLAGELSLALISAAFALRHADRLALIPGACIAARGPVHSVLLFHRRPWRELRSVAVTHESASAAALLALLLRRDGVPARLVETTRGSEALADHDAVLLIGDRALRAAAAAPAPLVTDLAQEWWRQTGLPFVFGVWAQRRDAPAPAALVEVIARAHRAGPVARAVAAHVEARRLGIAPAAIERHLRALRYVPAAEEAYGLAAFATAVGAAEDLERLGPLVEPAAALSVA